ncbi:hypothetical protein [Achromobacter ruhlandii]|uniref:hypothetical protein n=1 Tax=Achromobacter ruhlandii TaxID=72557 RepID=UPI0012E36028|nr:hypothetical protein [Achromobacter ruhlandii]
MRARAVVKCTAIGLTLGVFGFFAAIGCLTFFFAQKLGTLVPETSSDAAAWIQAIGSIAAIVGAFYVGKQQAVAAAKLAEDGRKKAHLERLEGYSAIVLNLVQRIASLEQALGYDTTNSFRFAWVWGQRSEFRVALEAVDRVPIHDFADPKKIDAALSIYGAAAEAFDEAEDVMNRWTADNAPEFLNAYEDLKEHIRVYAHRARARQSEIT